MNPEWTDEEGTLPTSFPGSSSEERGSWQRGWDLSRRDFVGHVQDRSVAQWPHDCNALVTMMWPGRLTTWLLVGLFKVRAQVARYLKFPCWNWTLNSSVFQGPMKTIPNVPFFAFLTNFAFSYFIFTISSFLSYYFERLSKKPAFCNSARILIAVLIEQLLMWRPHKVQLIFSVRARLLHYLL